MLLTRSDDTGDGKEERLTGGGGGGSGGRMQELLASYYGMQQRGVDSSTDVESTNFDAKAYARGLLRNDKVETLLRKDDEMVSSRGREGGREGEKGGRGEGRRGKGREITDCIYSRHFINTVRQNCCWPQVLVRASFFCALCIFVVGGRA